MLLLFFLKAEWRTHSIAQFLNIYHLKAFERMMETSSWNPECTKSFGHCMYEYYIQRDGHGKPFRFSYEVFLVFRLCVKILIEKDRAIFLGRRKAIFIFYSRSSLTATQSNSLSSNWAKTVFWIIKNGLGAYSAHGSGHGGDSGELSDVVLPSWTWHSGGRKYISKLIIR